MTHLHRFPSKILLFGEHSLLYGGEGLAIPSYDYCGNWIQDHGNHHGTDLFALAAYLKEHAHQFYNNIDVTSFLRDVDAGWTFHSSIPIGYGAGSSGAYSAAIYKRYSVEKDNDLEHIKSDLAVIESYFHGNSSGLDPLVSYSDSAFHIIKGIPRRTEIDPAMSALFRLKDTRIPRQGAPYISLFKSKMENKEFSNKIKTTLNPAVHNAINAMLIADKDELRKAFFEISYFQLVWMPEFIPLSWIRTWEQKLSESSGYYKLCGAGGGGFLLECKL
ncbi:MAG: hypothetical protein IPP89_18800 [Saprospiraceae bacterium]|nr:hypothetical protein [Candidatus Brachybacter algidus]MBL0120956.1 hypothetical protein [Candidatus Brachybacter algidus]